MSLFVVLLYQGGEQQVYDLLPAESSANCITLKLY
jgi:hypothetical protein